MDATLAIQRTIALYGQLLDDLRMLEWGQLFTEDAVWSIPGTTFQGRSAIVEGVRAMEAPVPGYVKHLSFTPTIHFEGEARARAWTDVLCVVRESFEAPWQIATAGRYCDELVGSDAGWQFKVRAADIEPERLPSVPFERSPRLG